MSDKNVKDFYTTRPDELKPGDVLVCVVTLHVMYHTKKGKPVYRMYRARYEGDDIPQGSNIISDVKKVGESLFPVIRDVLEAD